MSALVTTGRGTPREPRGTLRSPRARRWTRGSPTPSAGEDRGPEGLLAACLVLGVVCVSAGPAHAAFEVRDASPAALGLVSMDLDLEALGVGHDDDAGVHVGASHASLYQVEGLAADQAWARITGRAFVGALAWSQAGLPGERETRVRVSLRECCAEGIALGVSVERLDMTLEGEPPVGGWAAGGAVRSTFSIRGAALEAMIGADRLLRSASLGRLDIAPSVPVSVQLRAGSAAIAWIDRWESDGVRSPRIVIALVLGETATLRLARGDVPERVGTSISIRLRGFEVSAGRLDLAAGGSVTGFSLAWTGPRARDGA